MRKIFPYFCNKKCQLFSQTKVTFRSWDYTIIMLVERERVTLNLGTGWGNYCPPAPLVTSPLPGRSTCHQGFCVCQDRCKLLL